jgi:hypothetical protein
MRSSFLWSRQACTWPEKESPFVTGSIVRVDGGFGTMTL